MFENRTNIEDLKGRFVQQVLQKEGKEILQTQTKLMQQRSFKTVFRLPRSTNINENSLRINVTKIHRFIDMRTRKSRMGVKKKKNHPIYNRIIFGRLNNIARELSIGFTEATINELKNIEK